MYKDSSKSLVKANQAIASFYVYGLLTQLCDARTYYATTLDTHTPPVEDLS